MVMRIFLLGLVGLLGASPPAKDAVPQGIEAPPNLTAAYVRPAVDHVATYSYKRGWGAPVLDHITLWRHGSLVHERLQRAPAHENGAITDGFSNVLTHASLDAHLGAPGERAGFTLWRREAPVTRYMETKLQETRVIAGEKCTVYRFKPNGRDGVDYEACITGDGIVLYSAALYRDGSPLSEKIALSVKRQPVASAQVRPPQNLLDWPTWLARLGNAPPSSTGRPSNYDLRFGLSRSEDRPKTATRMRAAAGWVMTEARLADGALGSFFLYHSSGQLRLSMSPNQMSIQFDPAAKPGDPKLGTAPTKGPTKRILGETCRPINTTVNVSDYSKIECRTADGLPLEIDEDSWGMGTGRVANSLARGRTDSAQMKPPPGLLSWTRWGWPELDRR